MAKKSKHKQRAQDRQRDLSLLIRASTEAVTAAAPKPDRSAIGSWISLGIPVAIIGVGVSILPLTFAGGILLSCLGSIALLGVSLFQKQSSFQARISSALIAIAFLGLFLWLWFRPAPIQLTATPMPGGYREGANIGGISWKTSYSEGRIVISNQSNSDYVMLKLFIRTDLPIAKAGYNNRSSACQTRPWFPGLSGATVAPSDGKGDSIPLFMHDSDTLASDYFITCDRLIAGDQIEIIMALQGPQPLRPAPTWISADLSYDAFGRTRYADVLRQCFVEACKIVSPAFGHP